MTREANYVATAARQWAASDPLVPGAKIAAVFGPSRLVLAQLTARASRLT